jgi:kumamolisin
MHCRPYVKRPRAAAPLMPWSLDALCAAYGLPRNMPGGGKIGIVELGGTYAASDIAAFCAANQCAVPTISSVGTMFPSDPGSADLEVALDIELAAFIYWWCTGTPAEITMIWASDIAPGIASALSADCAVCSISWGAPENQWTSADAAQLSLGAWNATSQGMAICAASGDNDSGDGETGLHVDLPSSAPAILACSGTTKTPTAETVWNNGDGEGTGGGYSMYWPMPAWQIAGHAPQDSRGRMVGDVAANADPHTGYQIYVGGQWMTLGGTSAIAPLYAGFLAATGQRLGLVGSRFWSGLGAEFTRITQGDNGTWPGIVCDGLGAPNGAALAAALARRA